MRSYKNNNNELTLHLAWTQTKYLVLYKLLFIYTSFLYNTESNKSLQSYTYYYLSTNLIK